MVRRARPPFAVEWHDKVGFRDNAGDDEWLKVVGGKDWIVFSHDQKWHDELVNREAIKQHKIGCFYLWGASTPTWDKLRCFMRAAPNIQKLAATTAKPFIFRVDFFAKVKPVRIP